MVILAVDCHTPSAAQSLLAEMPAVFSRAEGFRANLEPESTTIRIEYHDLPGCPNPGALNQLWQVRTVSRLPQQPLRWEGGAIEADALL